MLTEAEQEEQVVSMEVPSLQSRVRGPALAGGLKVVMMESHQASLLKYLVDTSLAWREKLFVRYC